MDSGAGYIICDLYDMCNHSTTEIYQPKTLYAICLLLILKNKTKKIFDLSKLPMKIRDDLTA